MSGQNILATGSGSNKAINPATNFEIPAYDYFIITYVAAGNGTGEISTITYKLGGSSGTTVAVLTSTYDANDRLSTCTRSDS